MAFKFAFQSDDIEEDVSDSERAGQTADDSKEAETQTQTGDTQEQGGYLKAQIHTLDELVCVPSLYVEYPVLLSCLPTYLCLA
jgi:hypothetical protein